MNPADVEKEGDRLYELLEVETHEYGRMADAAAVAHYTYKIAHGVAMGMAEGTEAAKKSASDVATADELKAKLDTEAALDSQNKILAGIRTQMDWLRTASANVRQATT